MAVALAAAQRIAARSMRSNDLNNTKKRKIESGHSEVNTDIKTEIASENTGKSKSTPSIPVESSLIRERSKDQKRSTRSSTSAANTPSRVKPVKGGEAVIVIEEKGSNLSSTSSTPSLLEKKNKPDIIDQKPEQPQPSTIVELTPDSQIAQKEHESSEQKSSQQTTPPRRRESTRARRPSSRMLPSPSPPPPRSSSYYNYLKSSNSQPTLNATPPSGNAKSSASASNKKISASPISNQAASNGVTVGDTTSSSAVGDISIDSNTSEITLGPGKRKRRPSTMTRPPSTITQGVDAEYDTSANAPSNSRSKGRSLSKSVGPEDKVERLNNVQSSSKPSQKKEKSESGQYTKAKSASLTMIVDGPISKSVVSVIDNTPNEAEESDCGFESVSRYSTKSSVPTRKSESKTIPRNKGELTVDSMRAQALSSGMPLEPPPLISRRGGMKGSVTVHRQSSKSNHLHHSQHQTPPSARKWSWDRSAVSVPLLRFKLDNLKPRLDDEEESSAAEEEDDFHVAMLNSGDYDASSDCEEEDAPRANTPSAKSSPRAYKSHDSSDIDDTPATTPQSPRSTCEGIERRDSAGEEEVKPRSRTVTRDAVFAHALEPSSNRPHTHAGALTLSLPYNEMPQPKDEEASDAEPLSAGIVSRLLLPVDQNTMVNALKVEEVGADHLTNNEAGLPDENDGAAVASELLGTSNVISLDSVHRQMLSSPNPGSAFASPTISSVQHVKAEPAPLLLPPAMTGAKSNVRGSQSKLNESTRFDSASSSDADDEDDEDEENVFSQGALAFGPPESVCLSELERAWEQNEYLHQARKMAGDPIEMDGSEEEAERVYAIQESPMTRGGKRAGMELERKEQEENIVKNKRSRTAIKQTPPSPPSIRSSRRTTRKSGVHTKV